MSRAGAGADHAEKNRATLKALVKLEANKSCADCKRNKHPRWASWNIGVFICIRCSGIHRGMGTHISRVKSVDLDSWTDEQLKSMINWGNARANRYWEHKLAEGHVPNEAKIENFIRTKYDSKRWVMEGPLPNPATLDNPNEMDNDDDTPLSIVKERARSSSGANAVAPVNKNGSLPAVPQAPRAQRQEIDLFGDGPTPASAPIRPNTVEPAVPVTSTRNLAAPPRQNKPGESLLGLDFFGSPQAAGTARSASAGPNAAPSTGRTDLKQSILSLYASKPAPPPPQPVTNASGFGGMQTSPPLVSQPTSTTGAGAFGGLGDAFSSLSFGNTTPQQSQNSSFPATSSGPARQPPSAIPAPLSGGGFFDMKPTSKAPAVSSPVASRPRELSFGGDFGDFSSASTIAPVSKAPQSSSNGMGDLFGMSTPMQTSTPKPNATIPTSIASSKPPPISASGFSAFNLTQVAQKSAPKAPSTQSTTIPTFSSVDTMDAWGSNDAWASPDPPQTEAPPPPPKPASIAPTTPVSKPAASLPTSVSAFDNGWADAEPTRPAVSDFSSGNNQTAANTKTSAGGFSVQQDEEFGGWSHASPVAAPSGPKQGGVGGNADDLFGNVWG